MTFILPIQEPFINGYKVFDIPFAIMANYEKSKEWIINNYIQLCTPYELELDEHWLSFYTRYATRFDKSIPWIETSILSNQDINLYGIEEFLIQNLQNKSYMLLECDQFYFAHTYSYKNIHRGSPVLLFGYDNTEKKFHIMDYNFRTTNKFEKLTISMPDLVLSLQHQSIIQKQSNIICTKEGYYKVDHNLSFDLLKDYLESNSTAMRLNDDNPYFRKNITFGLSVYEDLIKYLDMMKANNILNNLPFHLLHMHKKILYHLLLVYKDNFDIDPGLIHSFDTLVYKEARLLENLYLKFAMSKNISILDTMIKKILSIMDGEEKIIRLALGAVNR